ncbi:MAG: hypothetical protein ACREOG_00075 [Gemmatimonadaceae bacterium]
MVALQLNVDFADAGHTLGTAGVRYGDLTLWYLSLGGLNGTSVRSFLAIANTALGGGSTSYAITDLMTIAIQLNQAFHEGMVSPFAQQHLVHGACP